MVWCDEDRGGVAVWCEGELEGDFGEWDRGSQCGRDEEIVGCGITLRGVPTTPPVQARLSPRAFTNEKGRVTCPYPRWIVVK